jgi:ribosomal protein S18 acetylase RimI-like enzyme
MAVEWRALRASDVPAAFALSRIAGWNQTEADWRDYLSHEPDGCVAAEVDGALGGTATSIRYGEAMGWVGMVLVHPGCRRRGLGTELLRRTIHYLTGRGTRSVKLDATPAGREVYLPLGFRDESVVTRFEGTAPGRQADDPPDEPQPGVEPLGSAELPAAADLDAEAFGVRRFGVLSALSRRNPAFCFVVREGREVRGYLIAREGREAIQLGPSVASDPVAAQRLFQAFLHAAHGRRVFLDLPAGNLAGTGLLERHGFTVQRKFTRMVLGEAGPSGREDIIYSTSGAEKG